MGITSLEWDPRGRGSKIGEQLLFADLGAFDNVYPHETAMTNQITDENIGSFPVINNGDPLVDDSLLMEVSKLLEIVDSSKTCTLHGHEAPLLCVKFDPRGELLVSE